MGPNMFEHYISFGEIFQSGEVTSFIWLRISRTSRLHLRLDDALWDRRFFVMSWGRVLRTPTLTANDWVRVPQVFVIWEQFWCLLRHLIISIVVRSTSSGEKIWNPGGTFRWILEITKLLNTFFKISNFFKFGGDSAMLSEVFFVF